MCCDVEVCDITFTITSYVVFCRFKLNFCTVDTYADKISSVILLSENYILNASVCLRQNLKLKLIF